MRKRQFEVIIDDRHYLVTANIETQRSAVIRVPNGTLYRCYGPLYFRTKGSFAQELEYGRPTHVERLREEPLPDEDVHLAIPICDGNNAKAS